MIETIPPALTGANALFLDFDGTLVGFARIPRDVTVAPRLVPTLERVRDRLGGALAIVTGREIANVTEMLAPLVTPVAGSHGAERRRPDGGIETPGADVAAEAAEIAARFRAELGDIDNMIIEHKVYSVALHFRNAPAAEDRVRAAAHAVLSHRPDWEGTPGKLVVEVRPAAFSKGSAVRAFMAEPPFAGRVPVFVGDDVTDEAGMEAAAALGGFGIKVGTGQTLARYRLSGPDEVHAYLSAFAD
ncbi:MAG: trehalose-phosphatase [Alphaproteobacteria bacterium]|nr:trehalose-phosphatase [Alphaproteobacteria bacterium]